MSVKLELQSATHPPVSWTGKTQFGQV